MKCSLANSPSLDASTLARTSSPLDFNFSAAFLYSGKKLMQKVEIIIWKES
jgi:hypothetical protein